MCLPPRMPARVNLWEVNTIYDREHILSIGGGGRVGGGRDACAKSDHELAGASLFTEDGDVVPLRVSAAAFSWGVEGRGGGPTEMTKVADLDFEYVCVCVCVCVCV